MVVFSGLIPTPGHWGVLCRSSFVVNVYMACILHSWGLHLWKEKSRKVASLFKMNRRKFWKKNSSYTSENVVDALSSVYFLCECPFSFPVHSTFHSSQGLYLGCAFVPYSCHSATCRVWKGPAFTLCVNLLVKSTLSSVGCWCFLSNGLVCQEGDLYAYLWNCESFCLFVTIYTGNRYNISWYIMCILKMDQCVALNFTLQAVWDVGMHR